LKKEKIGRISKDRIKKAEKEKKKKVGLRDREDDTNFKNEA
jgi:hypothetical protein